ncbi:Integral membrane protein OS=Streptomyces fumanus OX=67302 GN=GCM10018772_47430 PE=4 SV=1 [Streptomyces fumanus]|uniref:Uncharacterized protein n=2 Tax=Streptomyces fumanus TaxID=67302 RepID=A0A919E6C6_9ACTN|nr:hypothetical protein GCM10018772_47430 [Streptomyces fumanus]
MEGTKYPLPDSRPPPSLEDRMIAETVCSAVSAAGLGIAAVTAYRRRFLAAVRIAAYSLIPVGLVMTGVVDWVSDTAFSPTAWAGFGVLGAAWLLFLTTRAVERRRGGTRKERRAARAAARDAVAPAASAPSLGGAPAAARPAARPAAKPRGEDDFSDIEAILKKHGI